MLNWHSFIGILFGQFSYLCPGILVGGMQELGQLFLIPALLTCSLIWKIKRDAFSLALKRAFKGGEGQKFGHLFIIIIFEPWNNAVFDFYFTEENETLGQIYWSLEGNSCKQINTTQACLLYILFLFLCNLLIDLPQGRDSSDSDTKQVLKENISFKKGAEERAAVAKIANLSFAGATEHLDSMKLL